MRTSRFYKTVSMAAFVAALSASAFCAEPPDRVDFSQDVYPLLRRSCFECHGPAEQEGGLRLDQKDAALAGGDTGAVVVPGKPAESELLRRISLPEDDAEVMPASGDRLSTEEVAQIRKWIAAGAEWPDNVEGLTHWSYVKPVRPQLPQVQQFDWTRNAIDTFILARLEDEGMSPSPEAEKATVMRRLFLDLVGLPPTPAEVDAFLANQSESAYEDLVDDLLSRPQFGERWARPWLDLARYADSHGFQRDDFRDVWAYRDWVIDALNADMPFDQFTIEQIAGDLLPDATESQRIATGFHRCTPTNVEAGSIPEETRIEEVIDRVNTTGTVWLGTTLECCQCHDHKFDPFTQKDYYRLLAFFNNTEMEADRAQPDVPGSIRFVGPTMNLSNVKRDAVRAEIERQMADLKTQIAARKKELEASLDAWSQPLASQLDRAPREHVLQIASFDSRGATDEAEILDDGSVLLVGDDPPERDTYVVTAETDLTDIRAIKLEALTHDSLPGSGPGRGDEKRTNFVLHSFAATIETNTETAMPVEFVKARASFSQQKWDVAGAIDHDPQTGWAIAPKFGEPHWAIFETDEPVGTAVGATLTFTLTQNFGGSRTIGRLRLSAITGELGAGEVPDDVAILLAKASADLSGKERKRLVEYRASQDEVFLNLQKLVGRFEKQLRKLAADTTLVMKELAEPRETTVFVRGDYRNPGERVQPGVPEVLHSMNDDPPNRLALAQWLVDGENPLVARVTVNRWWAELFGRGLVATVEDFGVKGEPPTHPQLLDWLAVEFMESGWSMKHILKTIVTSATYRQSSAVTEEQLARDDQNRLYGRGPSFRMSAEMIRDNALAIAGLISLEQGGPPIKPYQPEGIWSKVGGMAYEYFVSPGDEKYRRGIYVVFKRGAPYPSFMAFDASTRLACTVKRSRTNTPLQALTLLNDPVYVEAAEGLARRVLAERREASDAGRLRYAFRICTARPPDDHELKILSRLLAQQREAGLAQRDAGKAKDDNADAREGGPPVELSAWKAAAAALLNLDETITKE